MVVKDYIDVRTTPVIQIFDGVLAKKEQEFVHAHKPFDSICARLEYKDRLEQAEKESERRHGFVKHDELNVEIGDLDKYGDADRFELLEDQANEDVVITGSKLKEVIGHTLSYRCKARGHGIAVFIPIAEYVKPKEELKGKFKKAKKEE